MNKIKKLLICLISLGNKKKIAKKLGVKFGDNCRFLGDPFSMFGSEPFLIEIGNHVSISSGTTFVNHYGELWTIRKEIKFDRFGKIKIGNNVFVGQNVLIMPNVIIGDNVVIGANSLINKDVPANSIVAGSPAKVINSFETFVDKQNKLGFIDLNKVNGKTRKKKILNSLENK